MTTAPAAPAANSNADIMGEDVANLYAIYGKLSAAASNPEQIAAESASYETILQSVKGSDAVKQLAADYVRHTPIPQFLHYFPALVERGINAQLDLIEDEKAIIRIHAIRGLELITKHNPTTVGRIADVLAQLLIVQEALELNVVKTTFTSLFVINAQAALIALLTQAATATDATLRKAVIAFLQGQLKSSLASLKKDAAASAAVCGGIKSMLATATATPLEQKELRFFIQSLIALCPHGNAPAKIRADEPLKAELAAIAATQSGLDEEGNLDCSPQNAAHFLSVQPIVGTLIREYGIDSTPFVHVFFQQLLPNIVVFAEEFRGQILHAVANAAAKLTPKQAQDNFDSMWQRFKMFVETGVIKPKPVAPVAGEAAPAAAPAADAEMTDEAGVITLPIDFTYAEFYVYLFHLFAPLAPAQLKSATAFFEPTGQPGENLSAHSEQRDEFINRIQFLLQSAAEDKEKLNASSRAISDQIKSGLQRIARLEAIALGKDPETRAAAATGQPMAQRPKVEEAATPAATIEEERAQLKSLREKQNGIRTSIRIIANTAAIAQPLLTKPLPTFLPEAKLTASWRRRPAPEDKTAPKKQQGKGQKRKSSGPDSQAASASNKKQGGQQQQQQGKKQKTQQQQQQQGNQARSNKKNQQQQQPQQQQQQGGGRRRRR